MIDTIFFPLCFLSRYLSLFSSVWNKNRDGNILKLDKEMEDLAQVGARTNMNMRVSG